MKLLVAFLRLIRLPNLFFIVLTQALFYYCILLPSFEAEFHGAGINVLHPAQFWILCLSSILIAAAGYTINDYFDLYIDSVNRPQRIIVEKVIKRRWTIVWHWILSGLGILLGFYLGWVLPNRFIGIANVVCVALLWFYSTTLKKKLLIGNVVISLLTAWVILVLYLCEFKFRRFMDPGYQHMLSKVFKFSILYGSFAFIISLIREVIKDAEDVYGDERYGCRTMPVVWGMHVTKLFVATWLIILIVALIVIEFYVLQYRWWWAIAYACLFVILPLLVVLRRLRSAMTSHDYHQLSQMVKAVMLAGILSMLFLKFSTSWNV